MKIIIRCAIRKCHIACQVLQFAYLCDRQGEPPARWGFRPDEFRNERSSGTKNCAVACTSWVAIGEEEIHDIVSLFNLALGSVLLRIDCPLSNDQMKLFFFFFGRCDCFFFLGGCFILQVFSVNVAVQSKPYLRFQISLNGAGRFCLKRRRIENHHHHHQQQQQATGPHGDLLTIVKRRKLQWYGHVSPSSGLAKTILQGTVKGGRRQGRERKKWEDNIREWTGLEFGKS